MLNKSQIVNILDYKKQKKGSQNFVRFRNGNSKGNILCLHGPGVGKTSIAKSIAEELGRKFSRIYLGGITDQAEIRGHRITYVAALPGVLIRTLIKTKSNNPVILLDEIQKLGISYRGNRTNALLQSQILTKLFFCRSLCNGIQQLIDFDDDTIKEIIKYSDQMRVRQMERDISKICRKVAYKGERIIINPPKVIQIQEKENRKNCGVELELLAWTVFGGKVLQYKLLNLQVKVKLKQQGNWEML